MQVSIFTHIYPAPENIGIEPDTSVIHYIAKEFQKMGHDVQVFYLYHWPIKLIRRGLKYLIPKKTEYVYDGIKVCLIQYQLLIPKRRFPQKFQAKIIDRIISSVNKRDSRKNEKIFVHFPTFFCGVNSIFEKGSNIISVFHYSDVINLGINSGKEVREYLMKYPKWGARNKSIHDMLLEKFGKDSVIVHTGIDSDLIRNSSLIERKKETTSEIMRIVYVGKLIKRKHADKLISAVEKLSFPYTLEIIGDGPEMSPLSEMAKGNENITITGALPREQVMERMYLSDVFVMASEKETYGLVYLEAMGQGCISVGSKNEGVDGIIINNENGFLINAGSVEDIVSILEKIHAMTPEEKSRMIDSGYKTTCEMTSGKTAKIYFDNNNVVIGK